MYKMFLTLKLDTLEDELQAIVVLSATLGTAQGNLFPMVVL